MQSKKAFALLIVLMTIVAAVPITIIATADSAQTNGYIEGTVYSDENQNKVFDSGEVGVAGVTVQVYYQTGGVITETTTDANGHYSICIAPGEYTVKFVLPPGYDNTTPFTVHATVTSGNIADVDCGFIVPAGAEIQECATTPENLGWARNISPGNNTFGIIKNCSVDEDNLLLNRETGRIDLSPFTDLQNVLPWPVIKSVSPSIVTSGRTATFTVDVEYPFPGTTATITDTLPSGFTGATNFRLDGVPITPSRQTSGFVEFDNVPSPSASSLTGVRTLTFTATAPTVTSTTALTDTATVQFYTCGVPYGPYFYYSTRVTVTP